MNYIPNYIEYDILNVEIDTKIYIKIDNNDDMEEINIKDINDKVFKL